MVFAALSTAQWFSVWLSIWLSATTTLTIREQRVPSLSRPCRALHGRKPIHQSINNPTFTRHIEEKASERRSGSSLEFFASCGFRAAMLTIKVSEEPMVTSRYARVLYATALGLVSLVLTVLLNQPAPVIVYKTF
jgi:hypothetical protein